MAGLTAQERLQPSLLDRLIDDDPSNAREALEARVLNRQQLRQAILRDLSWLLNSSRDQPDYRCPDTDRVKMWEQAPEARRSVANFGIPSLSGMMASAMDFALLEMAVKEAIIQFEPRIDSRTLTVEVNRDAGFNFAGNSIKLVIRGQSWNQPVPLELLLSADVDIETGMTAIRDMRV